MLKYLISFIFLILIVNKSICSIDDDLFDEFDEFDEFEESYHHKEESSQEQGNINLDNVKTKTTVQDFDEDEFEGIDEVVRPKEKEATENLKEAPLPPVKNNYYMEIGFISFLVVYVINYFIGSRKNKQIATEWAAEFKDLFKEQFTSVGENNAILIRESQHTYRMICTGRANCIGLQVNIRLNRRYDIISMLYGFFSPSSDLVDIQVALNDSCMDSFVFALTYSMEGREMIKELKDITTLTKNNKVEGLNNQFVVHSEFRDATSILLRDTVKSTLNKHKDLMRLIYITDQSIQNTRYKKVARFVYALPTKDRFNDLMTIFKMTFFIIDRIKDFKLNPSQKKKASERRFDLTKEERKQAIEEKKEELQRKKYENATPEQIEKWKKKELKKRANANKIKIVH